MSAQPAAPSVTVSVAHAIDGSWAKSGRWMYLVILRMEGGETCEAKRRYSEFSELRNTYAPLRQGAGADFPAKTLVNFGSQSHALASKRCVVLERFLAHAVSVAVVTRLAQAGGGGDGGGGGGGGGAAAGGGAGGKGGC